MNDQYFEQRAIWFKYLLFCRDHFRKNIFFLTVKGLNPKNKETVLDLGVSDVDMNYFHKLYAHRYNITAAGLARTNPLITGNYPEIKYVKVNKSFPYQFKDNEFDILHSSAVIEHVGDRKNQLEFLKECYRIGKRGVITAPNRWYPVELHTYVPFIHWLPTHVYRKVFHKLGFEIYSKEENLNLLTKKDLIKMAEELQFKKYWIREKKTLGFTSNFLLFWKK